MKSKPHLGITLTIIYLALVSSCLAIYHLIVKFISDPDQQAMFANLLAWSSTLFATIALLYTFKEWRTQKASDVIGVVSGNGKYSTLRFFNCAQWPKFSTTYLGFASP